MRKATKTLNLIKKMKNNLKGLLMKRMKSLTSEEWRSDAITRNDFDFDKSYVGPKVRMSPKKSVLDFFELIFTDDLNGLITTETNQYATQQRRAL